MAFIIFIKSLSKINVKKFSFFYFLFWKTVMERHLGARYAQDLVVQMFKEVENSERFKASLFSINSA